MQLDFTSPDSSGDFNGTENGEGSDYCFFLTPANVATINEITN
jgi:hypothetical protein